MIFSLAETTASSGLSVSGLSDVSGVSLSYYTSDCEAPLLRMSEEEQIRRAIEVSELHRLLRFCPGEVKTFKLNILTNITSL